MIGGPVFLINRGAVMGRRTLPPQPPTTGPAWGRALRAMAMALVLGIGWGAALAEAPGVPGAPGVEDGEPITHRLFDANHCLGRIQRRADRGTVEFHWKCATAKMITMACVFDGAGYPGLGQQFARPGWHCNYPLPIATGAGEERAGDVAVGDVTGKAYWAACFVASYGDFASREKPYHRTGCWRAMRDITRAVRQHRRDPALVARELLSR